MNAQKMFEALDYIKNFKEPLPHFITYVKTTRVFTTKIVFNTITKEISMHEIVHIGHSTYCKVSMSIELYEAIHQQVKELGWISSNGE